MIVEDLDILEEWLKDSTENLNIRKGDGLLDLTWRNMGHDNYSYCWIMDRVNGEFTVLMSSLFLFPSGCGTVIKDSDPPEIWEKTLFQVIGKKKRPRLVKSYKEWAKEKGKI